MRLPHPSGVAFDASRERLYVASTRNPNQIFAFGRVAGALPRGDVGRSAASFAGRLVPVQSWYLPGCAYVHDLAMIGGQLHANSVGTNTVVALDDNGAHPVWWPTSIERDGKPATDRNYLQLNSLAAGPDLAGSFFTASGAAPGRYRPGHLKYPVDRRGVVFSGATREPIARGLTRPHSARLDAGRLWLDDSGYGTVGVIEGGRYEPVAQLPGWTRGLGFAGGIAFVGTSRVIPRFAHYAPGLDLARSRCALHALDTASGNLLGSLTFPQGNQIFAIQPVPATWTDGLPFDTTRRPHASRALFYAFALNR
ncbi:MAG: DUF4915 domain-containing protein [Candidatus Eremiobacteraeota bacterium]|nr:DUF4915 domain-containing protein [Candidatus Eremiobacteraeota bacterium]